MNRARDTLVVGAAYAACALLVAALAAIVGDLVARGASTLSWSVLVDAPQRAGVAGGVGPVIVSTLLVVAVAIAAAVPVGVAAAVALVEATLARPRAARVARTSLDVLAGVPSIVLGLFGMKLFCEHLRMGWSIAAGGLTLAWMILPMIVRATEEGLRAVPTRQRDACRALGASRMGALLHVELPAAAPLIGAGLVLGVGRALAESATVLFTAGASLRMPTSLLDPGRTLAVHVYTLSIEVPGGARAAAATAVVLVVLITAATLAADAVVRGLARAARSAR